MSKIQNTPSEILRKYGCANVVKPFMYQPFEKMSSSTICLAQSINSVTSIDRVYEIVKAIAEEPSINEKYGEMSRNAAAVWFAEEAFVNTWGWWVENIEAKGNYKPHEHNQKYLKQIQGDVEKFLKFALDKYWSVLGSESKKYFGQCYFVDHDVLIENYAHIMDEYDALDDEIDAENESKFDRSLVRIAKIDRKTKYVQLGIDFDE
jgi:hypothetical protein